MSYELQYLDKDHGVFISKSHRFGTDAFLLANFSSPKHRERVCDFGTGCGIIPMILQKNFQPACITGIDVQKMAINQFQKSIDYFHLQDKMKAVCADIKSLPDDIKNNHYDLITCNPPYKVAGKGILSVAAADQIARHETMCTIEDLCSSAKALLNFGGRFCLCQRPERLADTIATMKQAGLEPKRLRFVAKNAKSPPWLFLIEGKKGSKPFLTVDPLFMIEGDNGFSDELLKIYGKK